MSVRVCVTNCLLPINVDCLSLPISLTSHNVTLCAPCPRPHISHIACVQLKEDETVSLHQQFTQRDLHAIPQELRDKWSLMVRCSLH